MVVHLGVVMMGNGAHAAAAAGVLQALALRGIEPIAVCGMQGGAIPAALYLAGMSADDLACAAEADSRSGRRLLPLRRFAGRDVFRCGGMLLRGERLERLLIERTGGRLLSVCPRTGAILCRFARTGRHVAFSTRAYMQEAGALLCMQTSVGFAARAAAAIPPFLSPLSWMGSLLLPETDPYFACKQLFLLGAQRVLVISLYPSPRCAPDAMDLTGMTMDVPLSAPQDPRIGVLHVQMPDDVGSMDFAKMPACVQAGRLAAERELDRLFESMGMAFCRVLPFRARKD